MESLGDTKKGWKKVSDPKSSSIGATILSQEADHLAKLHSIKTFSDGTLKRPKNCMELNRDWRRQQDRHAKLNYLLLVGEIRTAKLLANGADTDLFEEILKFVNDLVHDEEFGTMPEAPVFNALAWLKELSNMEKFGFIASFMDVKLMEQLTDWIRRRSEGSAMLLELCERYSRKEEFYI